MSTTLSSSEHDKLREALVKLHAELNQARRDLGSPHEAELMEANAKLVIAVLRSDAIAEAALHNLSELSLSSFRDVLTGTPNRLLMQDHLKSAIAIARRAKSHFAVFFIDFDYFRQINRGLGHAAGDEVLRLGAKRMESVIRDTDTLSRQGGDEFLALITELDNPADAAYIARKMLTALAQPAEIAGHKLALSASIGIAIYPEDGETVDLLVQHADAAMYRAKNVEPGSYRFYADGDAVPSLATSASATEAYALPQTRDEERQTNLREANAQLLITALRAQVQEQQLRDEQKQQAKFMAMVAHELRHPLTPLKLAADMLVSHDGGDRASMERYQGIIDREVTHMSRVIGDLLDGTRIHAGKLRLQRRHLDMAATLRQIGESCQPTFERRQQSLQLELPPGHAGFNGDPVRLTQVFSNLLDNASKYTPEGGRITLGMSVHAEALVICVSDSGIGIAPESLEAIFGLFVQADSASAFANEGVGIGLAVVRELVQAHGGTVVVHSGGAGLGSRFIVTLPSTEPIEDLLTS